ncbi:MAG: TA system VapC family ribonuclease toxin [Planctomycetaceae bacterium]|nr:PIN domain-containing protein [Planctomycetaceae bacterium]
MFVVDTNILVYAADRHADEHARCLKLIEGLRRGVEPWYLTWPTVYEFLRVVTHRKVLRHPWSLAEALQFINALMEADNLSLLPETPRHMAVLADLAAQSHVSGGNTVFDLHIAALMKEHGLSRIYTRDTDFHRFTFIEVVDPLQK